VREFRKQRSSRAVHHLRIEIRNDVLEGRNRLLNGRNLQEFRIVNRPDAILKRNDQLTPPLFELDER
jgi:hypothetical protein